MPKFKIEQSDDRFSTDGMTHWNGSWNRISKRSTTGGRHIDALGVFFEPFVIINRADGKLRSLGFSFRNAIWRDNVSGAPLAIGLPQRVTFLTGEGGPIALTIKDPKIDRQEVANCDRVTLNCTSQESERGMIEISPETYARIMNATALVARIEGASRSWVYDAKDIDPLFFQNLRRFYAEHVAGAL